MSAITLSCRLVSTGEQRREHAARPVVEKRMARPEDPLAAIDLFRLVRPIQRREIARQLRIRRYGSGQVIVGHRDPTRDVFFILEGRVRVTLFSSSGREISFRDLSAGESFGELAAIDRQPRSANVLALTDCLVGSLDADLFLGSVYNTPPLAEALLLKLVGLVRALSERVYEFSQPVPVRVCRELLRLAQAHRIAPNRARIVPVPRHNEIASRINTHREAVSRTMTRLKRQGLVLGGRGELIVPDIRALEEWIGRLEEEHAGFHG